MISITKAEPQDFSSTDVLFQTAFWGKFREKVQDNHFAGGQSSFYFWANYKPDENSKSTVFPILIQARRTSGGTIYAYAQRAPAVILPEENKSALLEELADALREFLPQKTVFLRFDLPWNVPGIKDASERIEMQELAMNFGSALHNMRKAPSNHLCPDTVIIDLRPSPEKLLSSMRQQTRNSIRRAYKEEVDFSICDAKSPDLMKNLKEWHGIYEATAKRKKFYFEGFEYFKILFECAGNAGEEEKCRAAVRGKIKSSAGRFGSASKILSFHSVKRKQDAQRTYPRNLSETRILYVRGERAGKPAVHAELWASVGSHQIRAFKRLHSI